MRFGRVNFTHDYGLAVAGVVFDPATLTGISMAGTAVGGALSASSTLAGGDYAAQAGKLTATQLRSNASQAIASGQRAMFDTQLKTKLATSSSQAAAAGSGGSADTGSPLENVGELAQRGSYHAMIDMFNGESAATGLRNQADAAEWEGDMKKKSSRLAALGTLAGTVGSMASSYGKFAYPTARGPAGVGL